jgi:hypothetical protein
VDSPGFEPEEDVPGCSLTAFGALPGPGLRGDQRDLEDTILFQHPPSEARRFAVGASSDELPFGATPLTGTPVREREAREDRPFFT